MDQGNHKGGRRRRRRRGCENTEKHQAENQQHDAVEEVKIMQYHPHNSPLIHLDEGETWYKYGHQYPERDAVLKEGGKNTAVTIQKYRTLADTIYHREVQLHTTTSNNNSKDDRWVESTMRKGTLKDRIASMAVIVSTDPIHKFYALDGLLSMPEATANSRVAQLAAEAIEDLFLSTFLPDNRKLLTLAQRPLHIYEKETAEDNSRKKKSNSTKTLSPRILLLWRFEEMVKEKYDLFLRQYLAHTLQEGNVEAQKIAAVRSAANLLRSVPEGESALLQMIVNKLGDPTKKVAASAGHELRRTLQQHPAMQQVVAREVQQLAHRPHLSSKALYNCIIFLNQLKLRRDEKPSLAASLISTYFRLFEVAIHKATNVSKLRNATEEEAGMKSRLLSALLTGVNRAHPYLPAADQKMDEHVDALYRVVHTAPPGARTQSLLLLFHLAVGADDDNATGKEEKSRKERFYRALYSTLSQPAMLGAGKHLTMYFNLLYKAMKYDTDTSRLAAFAKRILCTVLHCSSNVTAACIFLLNEVGKTHPVLMTCYQEVLSGSDAIRVLDPTKREPRGALVSPADGKFSYEEQEKRAPGWELTLLTHHFHPTVKKFASSMGEENKYSGDPLKDFALAPFLDKFAYRNPKSAERVAGKFKRGQSIAERRSGNDSMIQSQFSLPVNDPSFLEKSNVDVQDEFFHKFFVERAKRDEAKGIVRHATVPSQDADKARLEGELDALDQEEAAVIDHHNFDEFENQWDTDEEEEAFVDSLAQKIIEDAIGVHGPNDLDDEDPDMDDWDDVYNSDSDEDAAHEKDDTDEEEGEAMQSDNVDNDDDALMEDVSDEGRDIIEAEFGDEDDGSKNDDDGGDMQYDLALVGEESTDDEEAPQLVKLPVEAHGIFAAAEDYAEIIEKSWNERKRPLLERNGHEDDSDGKEAAKKQSFKRKRRKKKRP